MSKSLEWTIMERAIKLVEAGWTKLAWARDTHGIPVNWESENAVSFCAVGAILRSTRETIGPDAIYTGISVRVCSLKGATYGGDLMHANDTGTKDSTLALMRERLAEV